MGLVSGWARYRSADGQSYVDDWVGRERECQACEAREAACQSATHEQASHLRASRRRCGYAGGRAGGAACRGWPTANEELETGSSRTTGRQRMRRPSGPIRYSTQSRYKPRRGRQRRCRAVTPPPSRTSKRYRDERTLRSHGVQSGSQLSGLKGNLFIQPTLQAARQLGWLTHKQPHRPPNKSTYAQPWPGNLLVLEVGQQSRNIPQPPPFPTHKSLQNQGREPPKRKTLGPCASRRKPALPQNHPYTHLFMPRYP